MRDLTTEIRLTISFFHGRIQIDFRLVSDSYVFSVKTKIDVPYMFYTYTSRVVMFGQS